MEKDVWNIKDRCLVPSGTMLESPAALIEALWLIIWPLLVNFALGFSLELSVFLSFSF